MATDGLVRRVLEAAGLTQRALAALLGVHPTTISRWATGRLPLGGAARVACEAILAGHLAVEVEAAKATHGDGRGHRKRPPGARPTVPTPERKP